MRKIIYSRSCCGWVYRKVVANTKLVEQWDGSNWTEVGDLNTRRKATGFGTATAAFAGGASPSPGNPGLDDNRIMEWI